MANSKYKSYYRRHLPHIHPPQAKYFITFRLADSLPRHVVQELKSEYQRLISTSKKKQVEIDVEQQINQFKLYFKRFDQLLDTSQHGSLWLKIPEVAQHVADALHYHDGKTYNLICYTIMPNHVHLLIDHSIEESNSPIHTLLQSIKKYSARRANKILNRKGKRFWQNESYDHVVRYDQEMENVIRYILYNPVKAGLCKNWQKWRWTYLKEEYKRFYI